MLALRTRLSNVLGLAIAISAALSCANREQNDTRPASTSSGTRTEPPARVHAAVLSPAGAVKDRKVVTFEGACDASGAAELDSRHFVVADDEDNVLRVYDSERGGPPVSEVDLSASVGLDPKKTKETDLEAAARFGDRGYFLSSHGRKVSGKRAPERLVFFAADLSRAPRDFSLAGQPYRSFLDDLTADPRLQRFGLQEAALLAPKQSGGLNLEGLTATGDGTLFVGFRSPVPDGLALVVELENPDGILNGERARFAPPLRLDLGGLGIRALSVWRSRYLALGGPTGDGGPFKLFRFARDGRVEPVPVDFTGFGPEGMFTPDSRDEVMVLSDDGTRLVNGTACKKLKNPEERSFRGIWLKLPA
jgi:hypothetical protein